MGNFEIRRFLSIGLVFIVFTTAMAWGAPALADNHCHKNHDKNCNHSEKNQNSSPKINCEIQIDAEDHLNNNDFGPTDQQCQNNSNNIKDSTVIQNPPSDGGIGSFIVVNTEPSDGDNNVPSDLSQITVNFNEKIDKSSIDTGSLSVFANNCGGTFCNDPDIQSVSVSGKSATFSINSNDRLSPNTNYIASISSSIQDQNGNFLDCANSKGVDNNCEWNFSTSGSTSNPTISINPTSGPVGTSVTVTGNGFDPISTVAITFGGSTVSTVTPDSSGGFTTTFRVPLSSSIGDQNVNATQGSNSASKTFKVTPLVNPNILLDPSSGPVGTSVDIAGAGFDPSSTITIEFDGTPVATSPSTVTSTPAGFFIATFNIPPSSDGDHTVKATEGSNSASKTFTVTSSTRPTIDLDPTSGPVGTSVDIRGTGFSPDSAVTITFGGSTVTTTPFPLTTNSSGGFSANFTVPQSSIGPVPVIATQGSNSASKTFTVTPGSTSHPNAADKTASSPSLSEKMILPDVFG